MAALRADIDVDTRGGCDFACPRARGDDDPIGVDRLPRRGDTPDLVVFDRETDGRRSLAYSGTANGGRSSEGSHESRRCEVRVLEQHRAQHLGAQRRLGLPTLVCVQPASLPSLE